KALFPPTPLAACRPKRKERNPLAPTYLHLGRGHTPSHWETVPRWGIQKNERGWGHFRGRPDHFANWARKRRNAVFRAGSRNRTLHDIRPIQTHDRMTYVKGAKAILQVLALTAVLLTWSSVDRIFTAITAHDNSLHMWFGSPRTPKEIHAGEIYNATIEWSSTLATRKTYLNVSCDFSLVCAASGTPSTTYRIDNLLIKKKDGSAYIDYPVTPLDVDPALEVASCYFALEYTYWSNVPGTKKSAGPSLIRTTDIAQSAVFKFVRAPRLLPLPLANSTVLSAEDRKLSLQLRVDDFTPAVPTSPATTSPPPPRTVQFTPPLTPHYYYTAVSIWPEDDPDWTLYEPHNVWELGMWGWCVVLGVVYYVVRVHPRTAHVMPRVREAVGERIVGWWGNDFEDPLVPRKTVRSRRRSILRDHIPQHSHGV
ncbi:uncharacterized protein EV422DRAFT_177707, partial [Fimicolochytrium jonesii]|uniref:uncharacterized protein n=1 Tax=Fimicolochytrium jonesii TaxID=1396493 RepID=UPI0022FF2037